MSVWTSTSSLLAIKPAVSVEGDLLRARTALVAQFLTLFSYCRRVFVDRAREKVGVETKYLWFFRSRRMIPFAEVAYIDMSFSSMGTSWGWSSDGHGATDQVEKFTVSLFLDSNEEVRLFSFVGEGACQTGWSGALFGGDSLVDYAGDQEGAARQFARALKEFIGVTIGKPVAHLADAQGQKFFCAECGRPSAPTLQKCFYCGGPVKPGE